MKNAFDSRNPEHLKERLAALLVLEKNPSAELQWLDDGGSWNPLKDDPREWNTPMRFRQKPKPEFVPWTAKDVPFICWIRRRQTESRYLVLRVGSDGVGAALPSASTAKIVDASYGDLFDLFEYMNVDTGTWERCQKEALQ